MRRLLALGAALIVLAAACANGDDAPQRPETLGDGEALGRIERLPGGTPVADSARLIEEIGCTGDELTVRTSQETLRTALPCDRLFDEATLPPFSGTAVAIRYEDQRLIIESAAAGTLEFSVEAPELEGIDDAP